MQQFAQLHFIARNWQRIAISQYTLKLWTGNATRSCRNLLLLSTFTREVQNPITWSFVVTFPVLFRDREWKSRNANIFANCKTSPFWKEAILPMLLHLLAERIAISSELDPNAAIVLSWSGFELFCEEKAKHHINNGPKTLVSCNNYWDYNYAAWPIVGKSIGDYLHRLFQTGS